MNHRINITMYAFESEIFKPEMKAEFLTDSLDTLHKGRRNAQTRTTTCHMCAVIGRLYTTYHLKFFSKSTDACIVFDRR